MFFVVLDFFGECGYHCIGLVGKGELILVIMFSFSRLIDVVSEGAP